MQTIQLPNELEHQLSVLAENKGRTLTEYVQDILTTYLERKPSVTHEILNENQLNNETKQAMQDCLNGKVTRYNNLDDMRTKLLEA